MLNSQTEIKKNLASYRLEKAKETLEEAKSLVENGFFRGGNNRAYYAIFNAMRALLALEGVDYKKHSGVIQHFNRNYIKTGIFDKELSKIVSTAEKIREASDYDDFFIASKEKTLEQLDGAEKLIQAVETYLEKL